MIEAGHVVTVARSLGELEALRPKWQSIDWPRIDADLDFYAALVRSRPEVVRPHALLVEVGGRPAAAVAARVEDIRLSTRLGYKTVFSPRVRSLTVGLGGATQVAEDGAGVAVLVDSLLQSLAEREADVLWVPSLQVDSPFVQALDERASAVRRQLFVEQRRHHRLVLPETFEEFMASRSSSVRKHLKQDQRKLERDFGADLSVELLCRPVDLGRIVRDVERIAGITYQRGLGVGFVDSPDQRALLDVALEKGWYRAYLLYKEDLPIAFWTGWAYGGAFFVGATGYDPAFAEYRVGTYLLTRVIADLCADETIRTVDYGPGDARYKHWFGNEVWIERDALVYAPSARCIGINVVRTAILASHVATKRILSSTAAGDRVKKVWRRRLRQ